MLRMGVDSEGFPTSPGFNGEKFFSCKNKKALHNFSGQYNVTLHEPGSARYF